MQWDLGNMERCQRGKTVLDKSKVNEILSTYITRLVVCFLFVFFVYYSQVGLSLTRYEIHFAPHSV